MIIFNLPPNTVAPGGLGRPWTGLDGLGQSWDGWGILGCRSRILIIAQLPNEPAWNVAGLVSYGLIVRGGRRLQ